MFTNLADRLDSTIDRLDAAEDDEKRQDKQPRTTHSLGSKNDKIQSFCGKDNSDGLYTCVPKKTNCPTK